MNGAAYHITREKHLDHLVRVVPLIVMGYGIQCYILMQLKGPFGGELFMGLGVTLVLMILGFIAYDTGHHVTLFEDHLEIEFKGHHRMVRFEEILSVETSDPKETFGTVSLSTRSKKIRLYFVDDVDKIKQWIESRRISTQLAA